MAKRKRQADKDDGYTPSTSRIKKAVKHELKTNSGHAPSSSRTKKAVKAESKTKNGHTPSTSRSEKAVKDEPSITRRHTRRMTTDAARDAVFHTAELLENIFEHVSPRRRIVAQMVCRQFRDIVNTSQKLQQDLMLKTRTDKEWVDEALKSLQDDPSDFIVAHNRALLQHEHADQDLRGEDLQRSYFVDPGEFRTIGGRFLLLPSVFAPRLPKETDSKRSWHDMQLSSPPANHARVEIRVRVGPDVVGASYRFHSDTPLTLGSIMREICSIESGTRRKGSMVDANAWCGGRGYQRFTFTLRSLVQGLERKHGVKAIVAGSPTISILSCLLPVAEE